MSLSFKPSVSEQLKRPKFPQRAVVTAGMPYGNKGLHFGHIGGVFVPADVWARFLRDRLGQDKVIFISGTDCYGSPILEGYRKACEHGFDASIESYVEQFHEQQKESLHDYHISLNLFAASGLDPAKDTHAKFSQTILERLYEEGSLQKMSSLQFYDTELNLFLNGRQVVGRCPVQSCKSTKAYADECDLGHQFEPADLIAPISQLSQTKPELREVDNFYFKLPDWRDYLIEHCKQQKQREDIRPVVKNSVEEFLGKPAIFIKNECQEAYEQHKTQLPPHRYYPAEQAKASFEIEFDNYQDRDTAREVLTRADIRFRSGKALVPFRLTGNIEWGVDAPNLEGNTGLTIWVWPESLWAPISFTQTVLTLAQKKAESLDYPFRPTQLDWKEWWCSDESQVYQFIGQDNIYFYGVAQVALFNALNWGLKQSTLIANHHMLFLGTKASSSGDIKPPLASELLEHYNAEQLRSHWISLGLDKKSVSFQPKVYDEANKNNERMADPALKEGALLTKVFNRLARSVFYGLQQECGGYLPKGEADEKVYALCKQHILEFEAALARFEFTTAFNLAENLIREANKSWSSASKAAKITREDGTMYLDKEAYIQALRDAAFYLRITSMLMHPIVPRGCEMIAHYFNLDSTQFFSWNTIFMSWDEFLETLGKKPGELLCRELPPRTDFFEKHPSQHF